MNQETHKNSYQSQQGFVLIIVVSILTVILALISIGFSRLSSRELIQAANRESASQAYYAAQSGINDATAYLKVGGQDFPGCAPIYSGTGPNPVNYFTTDLSGGSNLAKYSCISVDSTLSDLENDNVKPGQPWIVKIDAAHMDKLYIGWENSNYGGNTPDWLSPAHFSFGTLPQDSFYTSNPGTTGVLRVGLYPVKHTDISDNNDNLASDSRSYYLYPNQGVPPVGNIAYNSGEYSITSGPSGPTNGSFKPGECHLSSVAPDPLLVAYTHCNTRITALDGDHYYYYLYLTAQYAPLKIVIQGTGSQPITFSHAQTVIDVTGQSAGQIQRVRARVGTTDQFNAPNYAVQSMQTLCKAFSLQISGTSFTTTPTTGFSSAPANDCVLPPGGTVGSSSPLDRNGH